MMKDPRAISDYNCSEYRRRKEGKKELERNEKRERAERKNKERKMN